MATIQFKRATKAQQKLRLALYGPPGSGKTFTALRLGARLAAAAGAPMAVIDTERGRASLYSADFPFDVVELGQDPRDPAPFSPQHYEDAIRAAVAAGYAVLVIDSLSHAWVGRGGVLDQVDAITARNKGNSFRSWGGQQGGSALQNHLVDTILSAPVHVIATMRSKVEYAVETGLNGKSTPRKIGTAPVQRDGADYEFTLVGSMDAAIMTVEKSSGMTTVGRVVPQPGEAFADELLAWLSDGALVAPQAMPPALATAAAASLGQVEGEIAGLVYALALTPDQLRAGLHAYYGLQNLAELRPDQLTDLLGRLRAAANGHATKPST